MNRVAVALLPAVALSVAAPCSAGSQDALLDRMAAINQNLHAFTATMHAHVKMESFPFLAADLVGTYYFKQPDKNKVVFTGGVPVVAQQFDKLYAHIEPPSNWRRLYVVTAVSDNGTTAVFKLVPRKSGNVVSIDATANDRTATVTTMRWNYANGGFAEVNSRYTDRDGNLLVQSQTGHVSEPGYAATITSTLDDYKLNPNIADSVFSSE